MALEASLVHAIFHNLELCDRTQAITLAVQQHLTSPPNI